MSAMADIPKSIAITVTPDDVRGVDTVIEASPVAPSRTAVAGEAFRRGLALLVAEAKGGRRAGKRGAS